MNHFIEIDEDVEGNKYLVIHSGSRNLGKQVADYYQQLAIDNTLRRLNYLHKNLVDNAIDRYKEEGRTSELNGVLEKLRADHERKLEGLNKNLCYLSGLARECYLDDMKVCQEFAVLNRKLMADTILSKMGWKELDRFETIHNYISFKDNIVRKGAISARYGQKVLIPLNMRDGCILGVGKGNEDWNCSAPHGAGRMMSRKKAKESLSIDEFTETMEGIYSTTVLESTLDEAPFAYKPSEDIIELVQDTVKIQSILKPVYNFKSY